MMGTLPAAAEEAPKEVNAAVTVTTSDNGSADVVNDQPTVEEQEETTPEEGETPPTETTIVDSGTCGKNLTWTLDSEGTLTISGSGDMEDYNYRDEYQAPWSGEEIKKLVLEDGVTSVGAYAMWHCTELTSVSLPGTRTEEANDVADTKRWSKFYIGIYAFIGCTSLESIALPGGSEIGEGAFFNCIGLREVTEVGGRIWMESSSKKTTAFSYGEEPGNEYKSAKERGVKPLPDIHFTVFWGSGLHSVAVIQGQSYTAIGEPELSVSSVEIRNRQHGIKLRWHTGNDVTTFDVYRAKRNGPFQKIAEVKPEINAHMYISGYHYFDPAKTLTNGEWYRYRIVARYEDTTLKTKSFTICRLKMARLKSISRPRKGVMKLRWTRNFAADGYEIRYGRDGGEVLYGHCQTIRITDTSQRKKIVRNLKSGDRYYFTVRAYKKAGGKISYSDCSPWLTKIVR